MIGTDFTDVVKIGSSIVFIDSSDMMVEARGGIVREMPKLCNAYVQFSLASPSCGGNVISCTINRKIAFSSDTRENLWLYTLVKLMTCFDEKLIWDLPPRLFLIPFLSVAVLSDIFPVNISSTELYE